MHRNYRWANVHVRAEKVAVDDGTLANGALLARLRQRAVRVIAANVVSGQRVIGAGALAIVFWIQIDLIVDVALQQSRHLFVQPNGPLIWIAFPHLAI